MGTLTRKDYRGPVGEVVDWLEGPWAVLRPMTGHPLRVEEYLQDGSYVVRVELPGVDPEKDLTVTVDSGILTIKATRREGAAGKHHSEFRYGTFSRSVTLPAAADEDHIEAICSHGVLEVTVKLADKAAGAGGRKIGVREDQHIKPT